MSRPSRNIDQALKTAGRALLREHGANDLSLRQVAERAGANLGMFHYHFKSKDQFLQSVLTELYEEFFGKLEAAFLRDAEKKNPLERLRSLFLTFAQFAESNREILSSLAKDVFSGNKIVGKFVMDNFPRHVTLIMEAISECQERNLIRTDQSALQLLVICGTSLNLPTLIGGMITRAHPKFESLLEAEIFSPEAIEKRLDFVFRGLKP